LTIPGIIGAVLFGLRTANGSVGAAAWTGYALIICIPIYITGGVMDYFLIDTYKKEAMKHRE